MSRMYHQRKDNIAGPRGCAFNCTYCAFKGSFRRSSCEKCRAFQPHFHPESMQRKPPRTKGDEFITIGFTGDISFLDEENGELTAVLDYIRKYPDRIFLLQSKDPSLSPISGQIMCIGIGKGDEVTTFAGMPEAEMLRNFWDYMKDRVFNSRIVTFHGKSFDIPFIQLRSSNLHVSPDRGLPSIDCNIYYNNRHFDVLQVLSRRGSEPYLSLSDYCTIYGIPIDDTIKGCDIGPLWAAGKIEEIRKHCASDVKARWRPVSAARYCTR